MKPGADQISEHHRAAQSALQQGRLREAHRHCLTILELDRSHADAWFLCGVIAAHNGQIARSIEIFGNAVQLDPHRAEYRAELARQFVALGESGRALAAAGQALALEPPDAPTLNTLGTVFSHAGEHERALSCFERAVRALRGRPGGGDLLSDDWKAGLYCNLAVSLSFSGRLRDAAQSYETAIRLQPRLFKAHLGLAQLRRQPPGDNHLPRLLALRDSASTSLEQLQLGHAIAKEQEDLGHYSPALESLAWAKRRRAAEVAYSPAQDAALFSTVRRLFTRELYDRCRETISGCDCQEPIFVVGMPRTGTTLVQQILSSHSRVCAAGELQNLPLLVKRRTRTPSAEVLDEATLVRSLHLDMAGLGAAYVDSTRPRTGNTQHFVDKLPLNFLYLGLIRLALPRARLVCLRRNPMDACLSNYRQLFATGFRYYHYSYDLLDCGRYYIQFDQLMRHWRKVMPEAVYELQYESLVNDPEQAVAKLLANCGLPWEDRCLQFHNRQESVATASSVEVRKEIYRSAVGRWRCYGDALQPLYELLQSAGLDPESSRR